MPNSTLGDTNPSTNCTNSGRNVSIHDDDDIIEYSTDPELIEEKYEDKVDVVIDGGYGGNIPSTIVDCTQGEFDIVREGKGELELYL